MSDDAAHAREGSAASRLIAAGRARLKAGDHRTALAIAERLNELEPSPEALLFAGEVHFARGNFARAAAIADKCSAEFPSDLGGPVLHCRALLALGRIGEARDLALELAGRDVTADAHVEILVTVLSGCTEADKAWALSRKAVERDPGNPAAQRRLALACRMAGRVDEALAAANAAIAHDPHDYEMLGLRSSLRTATPAGNHVAELEALLAAGCRSVLGAARVAYALAKELEDMGEHERAFACYEIGARLKRSTLRSGIEDETATIALIRKHHDAEALRAEVRGFETTEPIFVLGLPRTGSTLIERILSSHPAVYAAGELLHLNAAMMEEIRRLGPVKSSEDLLRKSLQADPEAIGRNYLQRTRPFTGHTPHFIDKRPLNYLSIGIIHRALPRARIVHVRRTPMAACWAIYKFLFNDAYPWSYDLDEIARYYVAYRELMDHWRRVLPGRIIEVAYEDVVDDLEGEARKLVGSLGLEWDPACLRFHANEAATLTGSAVQVRRPIYRSSVDLWRRYESRLGGVARRLEAAGIDPYRP